MCGDLNENPIFKKKIFFEDWDFFSKLGKKSPQFHWEWGLRTHKKSLSGQLSYLLLNCLLVLSVTDTCQLESAEGREKSLPKYVARPGFYLIRTVDPSFTMHGSFKITNLAIY